MHTHYLPIHHCYKRHHIECIVEHFPEFAAYPVFALFVKTEQLVHACDLVVAAKKEDVLGVFEFIAEEQHYAFDGLWAAVYVISQKNVIHISRVP